MKVICTNHGADYLMEMHGANTIHPQIVAVSLHMTLQNQQQKLYIIMLFHV